MTDKHQETPKPITMGVKHRATELGEIQSDHRHKEVIAISPAIDWLSLTTRDDDTGANLWAMFCRYKRCFPLLAHDFTHVGGYKGQACVGWNWGVSEKLGYLFKATGESAQDALKYIETTRLADFRVTRIDLRVDVLLDPVNVNLASAVYEEHKNSKKPKFRLITGSGDAGETCYVGSMSSVMFSRIYDKGAERAQVPGHKWRYEVVFRKPTAHSVYEDARVAFNSDSLGDYIISCVASWLSGKGVFTPFDVTTEVRVPAINKPLTPYESKLKWLLTSVRPTVQLLVKAGFQEEVVEALQLDDVLGGRQK